MTAFTLACRAKGALAVGFAVALFAVGGSVAAVISAVETGRQWWRDG